MCLLGPGCYHKASSLWRQKTTSAADKLIDHINRHMSWLLRSILILSFPNTHSSLIYCLCPLHVFPFQLIHPAHGLCYLSNTAVLFAELMGLTACVYVCEGNSLERVSMVTQFYKFIMTHSLIASDVQKVFSFLMIVLVLMESPYSWYIRTDETHWFISRSSQNTSNSTYSKLRRH